jgi:hypothetical protein
MALRDLKNGHPLVPVLEQTPIWPMKGKPQVLHMWITKGTKKEDCKEIHKILSRCYIWVVKL